MNPTALSLLSRIGRQQLYSSVNILSVRSYKSNKPRSRFGPIDEGEPPPTKYPNHLKRRGERNLFGAEAKAAERLAVTQPPGHDKLSIEEVIKKLAAEETPTAKPVEVVTPFIKPQKKCIICMHNIPLDYKNVRLLNQFVSPHTGRVYSSRITGLCIPMQKRIAKLIKRARFFGLMPVMHRTPEFMADPPLFDPFRRDSVHQS